MDRRWARQHQEVCGSRNDDLAGESYHSNSVLLIVYLSSGWDAAHVSKVFVPPSFHILRTPVK
jgi:hypothetical protein